MREGIIFDVDGTLLDSMVIWDHAGERYLRRQGMEAESGLGERLFSMTMEEGAKYLKESYRLLQSTQEIIAGINEVVFAFYRDEAQAKKGVLEFLQKLREKEIPMTVATSTDRFLIEEAFGRLDMKKYFDRIFTCSEVGAGKNHPQIFYEASRFMGTKPEDTWVFEDGLYAIKTAKRAGYHTVGIYDASSWKDQESIKKEVDIYLKDWGEAEKIFEKRYES